MSLNDNTISVNKVTSVISDCFIRSSNTWTRRPRYSKCSTLPYLAGIGG